MATATGERISQTKIPLFKERGHELTCLRDLAETLLEEARTREKDLGRRLARGEQQYMATLENLIALSRPDVMGQPCFASLPPPRNGKRPAPDRCSDVTKRVLSAGGTNQSVQLRLGEVK